MRILFVGDVFGSPGRLAVEARLGGLRDELGIVLDFSGVEQQSLAHFTNDAGNHVEIDVRPAATLTLP